MLAKYFHIMIYIDFFNKVPGIHVKRKKKKNKSYFTHFCYKRICHRLAGLNNKDLLITILEDRKSKSKIMVDFVLDQSLLPGSYMIIISQCILTW